MKAIETLLATRPWIAYIDDERRYGHSIIVTLAPGWEFADDPGCGVAGFDTLAEVRSRTTAKCVIQWKD